MRTAVHTLAPDTLAPLKPIATVTFQNAGHNGGQNRSPIGGVSPAALRMGLQLQRASSLAMTRFQLALTRGDRRQALAAMDHLLDIDERVARFVTDLPTDDTGLRDIAGQIGEQKRAIAFEKLALVGGTGGPDLRTAAALPEIAAPASDWIATPANDEAAPDVTPLRLYPWLVALLVAVIAATLAVAGTMLV